MQLRCEMKRGSSRNPDSHYTMCELFQSFKRQMDEDRMETDLNKCSDQSS